MDVKEIIRDIVSDVTNSGETLRTRRLIRDQLSRYICVHELRWLVAHYAVTLLEDDVSRTLFYSYDWLWWDPSGQNMMPAVIRELTAYNRDTAFLLRELPFCDKDVFGALQPPEDLRAYCERPRCVYFKGCYCGDPLPLRDWVICQPSREHRFAQFL